MRYFALEYFRVFKRWRVLTTKMQKTEIEIHLWLGLLFICKEIGATCQQLTFSRIFNLRLTPLVLHSWLLWTILWGLRQFFNIYLLLLGFSLFPWSTTPGSIRYSFSERLPPDCKATTELNWGSLPEPEGYLAFLSHCSLQAGWSHRLRE